MLRSLLLVSLTVIFSSPSAFAGVNWTVVKACPQGLELVRGQAYAPAAPSINYQAVFGQEVIDSLSLQLKERVHHSVYGLEAVRWGEFNGNLYFEDRNQGFRRVNIRENGSDVILQVYDTEYRVIADYLFHHCN